MSRQIVVLLPVLVLCGCVTTEIRDYSDTEHAAQRTRSTAVIAETSDVGLAEAIEQGLQTDLAQHGVRTVRMQTLLPPTRAYTDKEVKNKLSRQGIDTVLAVHVLDSSESSQIIGLYSSGNAHVNTYGTAYGIGNMAYGNAYSNISMNTTTTPIRKFKRHTVAQTQLTDVASGQVVWRGQLETNAGGALFMSDSATASDLALRIVNALAQKGHIASRGK